MRAATSTAPAPRIVPRSMPTASAIPWRWSFDRGSGELWLNDVGQGTLEEVDRVTLGGNYGWRCFEGTTRHRPWPAVRTVRLRFAPVAQYGRTLGQSTTGGFVYRGSAIPTLHRPLRVRRFRHRQSLAHRARHAADADADAGNGAGHGSADLLVRRRTPTASCTSSISAARCTQLVHGHGRRAADSQRSSRRRAA